MKKLMVLSLVVSSLASFTSLVTCGVAQAKAARTPAASEVVAKPCDSNSPVQLQYFVQRKTYSNEQIAVYEVDTNGEPACCSTHLIVYIPATEGPGSSCFEVTSPVANMGFSGVNLSKAKSTYDAKTGLTLTMPFSFYNPDGDPSVRKHSITINQAKQTVQAQ